MGFLWIRMSSLFFLLNMCLDYRESTVLFMSVLKKRKGFTAFIRYQLFEAACLGGLTEYIVLICSVAIVRVVGTNWRFSFEWLYSHTLNHMWFPKRVNNLYIKHKSTSIERFPTYKYVLIVTFNWIIMSCDLNER